MTGYVFKNDVCLTSYNFQLNQPRIDFMICIDHLDTLESISTWAEVRTRLEHVLTEAQKRHEFVMFIIYLRK